MSQSEVVVPPVAPAAAAPVVPPAAPAAVTPTPVVAPVTAPTPVTVTPIVQPPQRLATDDSQADPAWLEKRLARERAKAIEAAGFATADEAKAAAAALKAQQEAEKATLTRLSEAQTLAAQLKQRSDAVTSLLAETANESFGKLTDAQKAAVRLQANDDAPAEDRIKAIRMVRAMAEAMAPTALTVTSAAPVATIPPVTPAVAVPAADTAPGRTQPGTGDTSPPNHRATYETMVKSNPFAAAQYGLEHPEAYKSA